MASLQRVWPLTQLTRSPGSRLPPRQPPRPASPLSLSPSSSARPVTVARLPLGTFQMGAATRGTRGFPTAALVTRLHQPRASPSSSPAPDQLLLHSFTHSFRRRVSKSHGMPRFDDHKTVQNPTWQSCLVAPPGGGPGAGDAGTQATPIYRPRLRARMVYVPNVHYGEITRER